MRTLLPAFICGLALLAVHFQAAAATATPAASVPATASSSPPPLTAFASLPATTRVVVSPGGKMLAWLDATSNEQRIILFDLAAGKEKRMIGIDPAMTFVWLGWGDDSTLLYELSSTVTVPARAGDHSAPDIQRQLYRIFSTDVEKATLHMMLSSDSDLPYMTGVELTKLHTSKPNTIIMVTQDATRGTDRPKLGTLITDSRASENWVSVVYEVDTHTGNGTRLDVGDAYTRNWLVNSDGKILGRTEWYPELQSYSVLAKRGLLWTEIYKVKRPTPPYFVGLDREQRAVLTIESDTDGRFKLWSLPLDGSPRKVAFEDSTRDVLGSFYDSANGDLLGIHLRGEPNSDVWFDKDEEQRRTALMRSFPNDRTVVASETSNRQLIVVRISSPSDPPTFYLVDLKTHQASSIGSEYPDLAGVKLGTVSSFTYKAHDGTALTGYLTLPPQARDFPPALVVLPHGGPASRDVDDDFEWLRQFFATRGYAVFQPQFRGSTGFGDSFEQAGDHQWGLLMQDDLTDGVRALIEKGQVDAHRIAIVGYSYGSGYAGYAALAGAAFTPDLYKCTISVNGISDLPRYLGFQIEMGGPYSDQVVYWRRKIGDQGDPTLIERSPDHKAEKFSAPVLLLYSDSDALVPINQSQLMAESLQKAGKSVQIVAIPNADHGLSRLPARLRSLEEIDKFLQDHL